jgi:hypothetical protein
LSAPTWKLAGRESDIGRIIAPTLCTQQQYVFAARREVQQGGWRAAAWRAWHIGLQVADDLVFPDLAIGGDVDVHRFNTA